MDRRIAAPIIQDDTRAITAQTFFETLYQHGDGQACLELRSLPSGRQVFLPWSQDGLEHTIASLTHENVYFGVATRKDDSGGGLKNCKELPVLFVDIDFKDTSEDRARKHLKDFALPVWSKNLSRLPASKIFKFFNADEYREGPRNPLRCDRFVIENIATDGNYRIYRLNRIGKTLAFS